MKVLRAGPVTVLPDALLDVFGSDGDSIEEVERRASAAFPHETPIVWECDAASFQFGYVSEAAAQLLGFPSRRWLEPMFWTEHIVAAEDLDDAVTYCALATAKARDHMFEYRARAADGRVVWLRDFVKVVARPGTASAVTLRGVMFDVTAEKLAHPAPTAEQRPLRSELIA